MGKFGNIFRKKGKKLLSIFIATSVFISSGLSAFALPENAEEANVTNEESAFEAYNEEALAERTLKTIRDFIENTGVSSKISDVLEDEEALNTDTEEVSSDEFLVELATANDSIRDRAAEDNSELHLSVISGYASIKIEWDKVDNATAYKIYAKNVDSGSFTLLSTMNGNRLDYYTYWHKGLGKGAERIYKVEALQGNNVLASSAEIQSDLTGEAGLVEASSLYKEYAQEEMYFDGKRVDKISEDDSELAEIITGLKEGSVIIKFRPVKGEGQNQALFTIKDKNERARKYNHDTRLINTKQASIYLWGQEDKTLRFALGHTQANTAGTYGEDEWHTVVFSNTETGSKILRLTSDGIERTSFGNANANKGFFSRIANTSAADMEVFIGGVIQPDGTTLRNTFKGDIKSVLVTGEIFTDADAIKLSEVAKGAIAENLFNNEAGNTWVFAGGRNTVGNYADIGGRRNYVSHFEEAIRWQFRNASFEETMERYVTNIARDDWSIENINQEYDRYISSLAPKAVAVMPETSDLDNIDESLETLKNLIIRNSQTARYSVIILPLPSGDDSMNIRIQQFKQGIKNIFTEVESIDEDYKKYLALIDTPAAFAEDNISDYLGENGYLNAKGHLKLAKYLSKKLAGKNFILSENALDEFTAKELEIIEELPVVTSGENSINISGVSGLNINNPGYEIYLNDGRKIFGQISGDAVRVSGIESSDTYMLRILNKNKATKYMYGDMQDGAVARDTFPFGRTQQQEEIAAKLEENADGAKWLFIGDSITHGAKHTGAYDDVTELFAKYLKEDLNRKKDIVINTGVSGQDSSEFTQNIARRYTAYQDADFVIMMLGTNDANNNTVSVDDFKTNISSFVDLVRSNQSVPIIRIPNSLASSAGDWATNLEEYAEALREVADDKDVLLIDHNTVWENEAKGAPYIKNKNGYWHNDSVHPNGRGQDIMFKDLVAGIFEGAENSRLYNVSYPIKKKITNIKVEPKLSNNNNSITVNPTQLTNLSQRGELGVIRLSAKTDSGQTYQIESRRNGSGRFAEFSLGNLPKARYTVKVEADLYNKPETLIFADRKIDLESTLDENGLSTIVNIEDVVIDGSRENVIDIPNKVNEIRAMDAMTIHFRYKVDSFNNSSNGLQALLGFSDSEQQSTYDTYGALYVHPSANTVGIEFKEAGDVIYSDSIADAGVKDKSWHTLSYVFTGSGGLKIYLDGALKKEESNVPSFRELNSTDILRLGEIGRDSNNWSFNGKFSVARVYNRALSEREVLDLHKSTAYLKDQAMPDTAIKTEDTSLFYANYGGSSNYRIPSLFTTKNGVVIAGIDKRNTGHTDMGNIDTAIRRSFDNGRTWEEIQVLIDIPGRGAGNLYPYLIDPVMFQDEETGRLYLMVDMYPESGGLFHPAANELGDGKIEVDFGGRRQKYAKLRNRTTGEVFFIDNEGIVRNVSDKSATTYTVPNYFTGELFNNGRAAGSIFVYSNANNWAGDLTVDKTSYLWLITSDDDGATWSAPRDITGDVKADWMSFLGLGPGVGIQIKNGEHRGRLALAVYSVNPYGGLHASQAAHVIYSDDRGLTWHRGESAVDGNVVGGEVQNSQFMEEPNNQVTESQIVEVGNNGTLKMFSRNVNPKKRVRISTSHDGGQTWEDEIVFDDNLPEPYCQLSVVRYPGLVNGKEAYIFANPASTSSRVNGTVRLGYYNQATDKFEWEHSKLIKPGTYAYSCATVMRNGNIGVLYENTAEDIRFTSMNLEWLMYEAGGNRAEINIVNANFEKLDNELNIELTLDQPVVKFGEVKLLVEVDGQERVAEYVSGDNSENLVFNLSLPSTARQVKVVGIRTGENSYIGNANNKGINDREFIHEIAEDDRDSDNNDNQGNNGNSGNNNGNQGNNNNSGNNNGNQGNNNNSGNNNGNQGNNGNSGNNNGNQGNNNNSGNNNGNQGNNNNSGNNSGNQGNNNNSGNGINRGGSSGSGSSGRGGSSGSGGSSGGSGAARAKAKATAETTMEIARFIKYKNNIDGKWKLADAANNTWQFVLNNGTFAKGFVNVENDNNGVKSIQSYYFDGKGTAISGWNKLSGDNWYYFINIPGSGYGQLYTGWFKDSMDNRWYYLDPATGIMKTGWQKINGAWYYLSPESIQQPRRALGSLYINERTPDGYFVNENGAWIEGR